MAKSNRKAEGQVPAGFNFTQQMQRLCTDIATRLPEMNHVDMQQVAVSFSQARTPELHGLQAKLTPLRFEGGKVVTKRRGRVWTVEKLLNHDGQELLYILSFYLPRFMDQPFAEKLTTIFHELWHISPHFDGDLRRHPGRCYAHSHSQKEYDEFSAELGRQWLKLNPPDELFSFLHLNFAQLWQLHGRVYGLKIRTPKLIATPD